MTRKILVLVVGVVLAGCSAKKVERGNIDPAAFQSFTPNRTAALNQASPFLKAHMKNGNLYVFSSWKAGDKSAGISGNAALFGPQRDKIGEGPVVLGYDSIAVLESNELITSGAATAITVFTGITLSVAAICITNPKACFGSCPTFYVSDGDSMRLQAEGFSSSISPALEATDIDALYRARPQNGELEVLMKNEALETHVVRWVDVLAVPHAEHCRAFATQDGKFWESPDQIVPRSAMGPEGDCLAAVASFDGRERLSFADAVNLAAKESIDLNFRARPGHSYGLVVACRQSLLPTYLLYQTYAYMGSQVGHWMAEIERGNFPKGAAAMEQLLGGIEVSEQQGGGAWKTEGTIAEHGPLAVDVHLLPLGRITDSTVNVRLKMSKGTWRIDYVALAELSRPLSPVRIAPSSVLKEAAEDPEALEKLHDSTQVLVTLPGDRYLLKYRLPGTGDRYELFLESRGYYLEWIRKEWIAEENQANLFQMFADPAGALRRMAPEFKRVELSMEDCFWRSRYGKQ